MYKSDIQIYSIGLDQSNDYDGDSNQTGDSTVPTGESNQTDEDEVTVTEIIANSNPTGEEESPPEPTGDSNPTGGDESSKDLKTQLQTVAGLIQAKMKSAGGFNQEELKSMISQSGMKLSPSVEKFNELDANNNGKIEESEVKSGTEGEDSDNIVKL